MPKYRVTEIVVYEVEADDEEHAVDIIIECDDPDAFFLEVRDRSAEEA